MDSKTPLRTAGLPAHILKIAYLIGKTPFRACRQDSRVSYTLYVPARQYCDVHDTLEAQPDSATTSEAVLLPLVVNVHGTRRDASLCRDSLIPFADTHGVAVLAPLFPAGLDGPSDLHSYKRLRSETLQSDLVLLSILDEVQQIWPGIDTRAVTMMGFSGGGQYVHRFMYIHPKRVRAAIVGAPGSITKLSSGDRWPGGIVDVAEVFGEHCTADMEAMRRVERILLVVGGDDGDEAAAGIKSAVSWLAEQGIARSQAQREGVTGGKGRLQSVTELQAHWREHGIESELEIVPCVGHEYLRVLPVMLQWLGEYFVTKIS